MKELEYLICFHISCMDGFASAWVVWNYLTHVELTSEQKMTFLACDYGDPIPDMQDKIVYIVDFSWSDKDGLLAEVAKAKRVVMLDHHVDAHKVWGGVELPKNMEYIYQANQSGVGLTWGHFNSDQLMPLVLRHIEDRDLWNWQMHGSVEVHAVLKSEGFMSRENNQERLFEKFRRFSEYSYFSRMEMSKIYEDGETIARAESALVDLILERTSRIVTFPIYECNGFDNVRETAYQVPIAEVPYDLASEAGDKLNKGYPFSVTYETQYALGRRKFSIRSNKETGIDVGAIARHEGGAGHKHAAGWISKIVLGDDFPWRFEKD